MSSSSTAPTTLNGQVAIVTGGTSGIGRASAIALAEAGAKVVVAGRRSNEGDEVVAEITAADGEATFVKTDVADEQQIEALVEETIKTYGQLDIAFNNAGIEGEPGPLLEVTSEGYDQVFDINVKGVLMSMKHQAAAMLKTGGGSIINTSSIFGFLGFPGVSIYSASKHAVIGMSKVAALEFAQQGIRVNVISPGAIETDMLNRFAGEDQDTLNFMAGLHPVGRLGKPREIADTVLFLASDAASFITGQTISVDGGFSAQ